jgi:hypothetical protein
MISAESPSEAVRSGPVRETQEPKNKLAAGAILQRCALWESQSEDSEKSARA